MRDLKKFRMSAVKKVKVIDKALEKSVNQIVLGHLHLLTFIKGRDMLDL